MKLIVVTLTGGLGNQLFQYAVARSISYRNSYTLLIDTTNYLDVNNIDPLCARKPGLQNFAFLGKFVTKMNFPYLYGNRYLKKAWSILQKYKLLKNWIFINENEEEYWKFNSDLYNLNTDCNVWLTYGFWQNMKYFMEIDQILRKEIVPIKPSDRENQYLEMQIKTSNSVSIHIRRGDMASISEVNRVFGVLSLDYYKNAISYITSRVEKPHFFIFSDDPEWSKNNIKLDYPTTYLDNNGFDRDYMDLYLMSCCQHQIISNSTFSWWAAWLGKKEGQIVIAPRKPFKSIDIPVSEYYPIDWRLL
jgi:hypothetical protein